jgi:broad specificity phosphatase PhoE
MTRQLILVKHSEPAIVEGVPAREWKLSEAGRIRASRLAELLAEYSPQVIVSSFEPKAVETANIIAGDLDLSLHLMENLHEHARDKVPFLSRSEFDKGISQFFEHLQELVFGNETAVQAQARFQQAVEQVLREYQYEIVVIVAHGTVISLFVSHLTGVSAYSFWRELGLPSFVVLDLKSKKLLDLKNLP